MNDFASRVFSFFVGDFIKKQKINCSKRLLAKKLKKNSKKTTLVS